MGLLKTSSISVPFHDVFQGIPSKSVKISGPTSTHRNSIAIMQTGPSSQLEVRGASLRPKVPRIEQGLRKFDSVELGGSEEAMRLYGRQTLTTTLKLHV